MAAYVWRTQVLPTPAQLGAHFYNPAFDTNFGFTAMVESSTPSGYTVAGPNTYVPVATGLDIFGFTFSTSQIDSFSAPAGTTRYQVIIPAYKEAVVFYNKSTGANTSALERDIIAVYPDNSLSHSISEIVPTITGTIESLYASYRSSGTGAGTYSTGYVVYDSTTQATDAYFQIFNPHGTAASTLMHPLHVTGVATEAASPEWQFRAGGGAYVSMTEQANHSLQFQGYDIDGSANATAFNIATGSTDITSAKFTQYSTSPNRFFVVYNEKNGATDNVVLKVFTPGTGVTNTQTFNIASGAEQKVRIGLDATLGTAIIAYGDDTATTLREFDSTGALLDTIVLSGVPFTSGGIERGNGLNSLDDGRVLVASSSDPNSTTTSVTLTTVDFRTTGLNTDNHTAAFGTQSEYAGTKFADTVLGGSGADVFMGMDGNDTFNGGNVVNTNEVDVAVFQTDRADYFVHTANVGGVLKTFVIQQAGALADGTDTLTSTELVWFNPGTAPDPTKFEAGHSFFNSGSQLNRIENFDGHRYDDVLFQHQGDGVVYFRDMEAGSAVGWGAATGVIGNLQVLGKGDADGDGIADVFLQDPTNGVVYGALQHNTGTPSYTQATGPLKGGGVDWKVVGAGDIDGDATVDVVIQEQASGWVYYGHVSNGVVTSYGVVSQGGLIGGGADWRVVGVGDVNRDGFADVVIQEQNNGLIYYRDMANGVPRPYGLVSDGLTSAWGVGGVADVNGDGFADVVIQQKAGGDAYFVNMINGFNSYGVIAANIGTNLIAEGVADVNNDGYVDAIFQDTPSGTAYVRYNGADGGQSWGLVAANIGTEWDVV